MVKSPRLSFKGYNLFKALYRNKDAVKAVLAVVTGASYLTGSFDYKAFLMGLAAAGIALISKLIWDAFDYYFSEVEN